MKESSIHQYICLLLHRQGTKATIKQAQRVSSHSNAKLLKSTPSKRKEEAPHSNAELLKFTPSKKKKRSTPSTPSAHTVTLTALPRKTTIAIRELEVAEVISPYGIRIRRRVDTVSSPGRANVWTVNLWTQRDHVLVDHATEEGVTAYRHIPVSDTSIRN